MRVGIPTEIKEDENRTAITPSGVGAFVTRGHSVLVESGAGRGSSIPDEAYLAAGATIVKDATQVWDAADLVLKVKEPLAAEFDLMRPGQILFTYLHLAASRGLTDALLARRVIGIGYETVQLSNGTLPLLLPMSEVAGRLSIQAGATSLEMVAGGKGILLPGVSGVRRGRVTIVGAGIVGLNACVVGVGLGADVTVIDIDPVRLAYVRDVVQGHVTTLMSNAANIEGSVSNADLVVCAVLIPGARTPQLISREYLRRMEPGSALVDVAVDQGGCAESSLPNDPPRTAIRGRGGCPLLRRQHARCRSTYLDVRPYERDTGICPGRRESGMAGSSSAESGACQGGQRRPRTGRSSGSG